MSKKHYKTRDFGFFTPEIWGWICHPQNLGGVGLQGMKASQPHFPHFPCFRVCIFRIFRVFRVFTPWSLLRPLFFWGEWGLPHFRIFPVSGSNRWFRKSDPPALLWPALRWQGIRGGVFPGVPKFDPFLKSFYRKSSIWVKKVQALQEQLSGRVPPL